MEILQDAFLYLLAAVVAVPLAKKFGLGSVLGYLIAGIVIGPVLGFIGAETEDIQHFAEFGVVMMLFLVGLELRPAILWRMRNRLFGLGGLQVGGTIVVLGIAGLLFDLSWQESLAISMTLALSSTAIVIQTLNEKGWMKTPAGQSAFSVLLFQDIAVIPMLALMPLLAIGSIEATGAASNAGAIGHLSGWVQAIIICGVIAGIIMAGKYLIRPIFRFIADAQLREIFTAAALLLVIAIALSMHLVGLSPALGTFLAGVVLSDSEYRHELESDIEPFKGLLLGLFFISVGAGVDFNLLFEDPILIIGLALAIITAKLFILMIVARTFNFPSREAWLFGLGLSQAGEFAFVLFGFAKINGVLPPDLVQTLILVVALSMLVTPLLFLVYEHIIVPRSIVEETKEADTIDEQANVVVAGVGRFGQVVARLLITNGYKVVVLDHDPQLIEQMGKIGIKTYYGDPTRPDLLRAAGVEKIEILIAALDDRESQTTLIRHVAKANPNCRIIARAKDRHHVYELENAGAHFIIREMFESALAAGREALSELGNHAFRSAQKARAFRKHDELVLELLREHWNQETYSQNYADVMRAQGEELYQIMKAEQADLEEEETLNEKDAYEDFDQQGV